MSIDYELQAHQAAVAHLEGLIDALEGAQEAAGEDVTADGFAGVPFCGCLDCCVREALSVAWPLMVRAARAEMASRN